MKVCDFSLAKPTSMFDLSLYQSITAFYLSLIVSSFYSLTTDCYTLGTPEAYLGLFNFVFYGMNEFILIYFLYTGSAYRKATSLTDSSLRYVGQFTQSFYETQERTEFLTINLKRVIERNAHDAWTHTQDYTRQLKKVLRYAIAKLAFACIIASFTIVYLLNFADPELTHSGSDQIKWRVLFTYACMYTLLDLFRICLILQDLRIGVILSPSDLHENELFMSISNFLAEHPDIAGLINLEAWVLPRAASPKENEAPVAP